MYIKIYNKSQLTLLWQLNSLLGKYKVPLEMLKEAEKILHLNGIGQNGFIAIILEPVTGNTVELLSILNYQPQELELYGDVEPIIISDRREWLSKKRSWYKDSFNIKGDTSMVHVLYSVKLKAYYDE